MPITYDPTKRATNLAKHGLDLADAGRVFSGLTLNLPDTRQNYGEVRIITVGHLEGRMVIVVWTPRGIARRIISMRKANDREQANYGPHLRS